MSSQGRITSKSAKVREVLIGYFKVLNRLLFSPMIEVDWRLTFGQIRFLTYSFLIPASNHVCADCAHELNAQKREAKFDSNVHWRLLADARGSQLDADFSWVPLRPPNPPRVNLRAPHEFVMIWMLLKMAAREIVGAWTQRPQMTMKFKQGARPLDV